MTSGIEGEILPEFAKKRSASDDVEYAADIAEDKDLVYLVENTCIHCNKLMKQGELKILPPSYMQERDPYVSKGVVKKRTMCVSCYNAIRSTAREKIRFDRFRSNNNNRTQIIKSIISRLVPNR